MKPPLLRLRDPGGRREYPWHLPFRRAVRHLPLGAWDVRVMDQNKVWVDSAGGVHQLADLSDEHLENVIAMLRHTAVSVFVEYCAMAGLGRFAPRTEPPPRDGSVQAVALGWVTDTPLWLSLHAEAATRTRRTRHAVHSLDATKGMWAVRTEGLTYILDLDHPQVMTAVAFEGTRSPALPSWRPLTSWAPIRVRRPLHLQEGRANRASTDAGTPVAACVVSIHALELGADSSTRHVVSLARRATKLGSPSQREDLQTRFRTAQFLDSAGEVRIMWTALDLLVRRHASTNACLAPARLRDYFAEPSAVDLLVDGIDVPTRYLLQSDVDAALGYQLPVTIPSDYPLRTPADLAAHSVPWRPGG